MPTKINAVVTVAPNHLGLEHKREINQTQEVTAVKEQIPYAERTYLAVPYDERREAKAIGARWDAVKKAWYVGPGVEPEKIAKWEIRHQQAATLDPRAEFAEVLRGLGAAVEGEHPIMNGNGNEYGRRTTSGALIATLSQY